MIRHPRFRRHSWYFWMYPVWECLETKRSSSDFEVIEETWERWDLRLQLLWVALDLELGWDDEVNEGAKLMLGLEGVVD